MYPEAAEIQKLVSGAKRIVVLQADNPDGDSLASALALEQILGDLDKDVYLYCGLDMPAHLRYLPGWDRVNKDLPSQFDLSIIVDTSADSLFEVLAKSGQKSWLTSKPCIVLDHHATEATITFAKVMCVQKAVATGEVIYELAKQLAWPLNHEAQNMIAISILADSLGLTSEATTGRSIHIIGELVEAGINLAELESERRQLMRKSPDILQYKADLIKRIEYGANGRIATIVIPWEEIEQYSHEYNPSVLVLDEMRFVTGVDVAIAFKVYKDGKITGKVRCNYGRAIGRELAEHFGGGGHPYASGFKIQDGRPLAEVKLECIDLAGQLLDKLEQGKSDATLQ
jgi:phosphoesterase RecJ-like protein